MPAWVNLNAGSTGADPALAITEVGLASGSEGLAKSRVDWEPGFTGASLVVRPV